LVDEAKYEIKTHDFVKSHLKKMRSEQLPQSSLRFDNEWTDLMPKWGGPAIDYTVRVSVNIEISAIKRRGQ